MNLPPAVGYTAQISARLAAMLTEIKLINTQPQRMVTLWPSTRVMYIVVERPYGTAIMAKDRPRTDSMDRFRGSSDL
jgi:predicted transcriptional regulator